MYAGLEDAIFTVFNKACIRHGDKNQWKLRKPERMKLYDKTFKAAIHLLQKEDVDEFQTAVKELNQRASNEKEARQQANSK